jgi:hypothetical protein
VILTGPEWIWGAGGFIPDYSKGCFDGKTKAAEGEIKFPAHVEIE